jgi:LPS sulfotransferase NodH
MTEIILCATQRCGSTMVIEDMRNTGVLGMPEEASDGSRLVTVS